MDGYLGEVSVDLESTEFANYTQQDWALYYITQYGQISGGHHKAWVIDQVARILNGTKVIVKQASWENGHKEYRVSLGRPSSDYKQWLEQMLGQHDDILDEFEYEYDHGIAP